MPRRLLLAALICPLLLAATASPAAGAASATRIANALERDPVFLEQGASPTLSTAQAGQVRLAIARRKPGRFKVAIVSADSAGRLGGSLPLANAIARRLDLRGSLFVMADAGPNRNAIVNSFGRTERVRSAAERGLRVGARKGLLVDQVLAVFDRVAQLDPGSSADRDQQGEGGASVPGTAPAVPPVRTPVTNPFEDVDDFADDVTGVVTIVIIAVSVIPALIVLFVIFKIFRAVTGVTRVSRVRGSVTQQQFGAPPPPSGPPPGWQPTAHSPPPPRPAPPPAPRPAAPAPPSPAPAPTPDPIFGSTPLPAQAAFGAPPPVPDIGAYGATTPEVPTSSLFGGDIDDGGGGSSLFEADDDDGSSSSLFGGGSEDR